MTFELKYMLVRKEKEMINVAIWGNYEESKIVKGIIEKYYNKCIEMMDGEILNVVEIDGNKNGENEDLDVAIISLTDYIKLYKKQVIPVLIIPVDNYLGADNLVMRLLKNGMNLEDIYCCNRITEDILDDEELTLEEIKYKMLLPFECCRYCTDAEEIDWDTIHKPSRLDDWIVSR